MGKLRHRRIEKLAQVCRTSNQRSVDANQGCLPPPSPYISPPYREAHKPRDVATLGGAADYWMTGLGF